MTISNSDLTKPIQRLFKLYLYGHWFLVAIVWLILAPWAIWQLQDDITLIHEYFTWVAVRSSLAFHLIPVYCLFFCFYMTVSILIRHSTYILKGLSPKEQLRLENQVKKIQATGPKHPLWKWIYRS